VSREFLVATFYVALSFSVLRPVELRRRRRAGGMQDDRRACGAIGVLERSRAGPRARHLQCSLLSSDPSLKHGRIEAAEKARFAATRGLFFQTPKLAEQSEKRALNIL
jgi:hypothetical protein